MIPLDKLDFSTLTSQVQDDLTRLKKTLSSDAIQVTCVTASYAKTLFEQLSQNPQNKNLKSLASKVVETVLNQTTKTGLLPSFRRISSAIKNLFKIGQLVSSECLLLKALRFEETAGLLYSLVDKDQPCGKHLNIIKNLQNTLLQDLPLKRDITWAPSDKLIKRGFTQDNLREISDLLDLLTYLSENPDSKGDSLELETLQPAALKSYLKGSVFFGESLNAFVEMGPGFRMHSLIKQFKAIIAWSNTKGQYVDRVRMENFIKSTIQAVVGSKEEGICAEEFLDALDYLVNVMPEMRSSIKKAFENLPAAQQHQQLSFAHATDHRLFEHPEKLALFVHQVPNLEGWKREQLEPADKISLPDLINIVKQRYVMPEGNTLALAQKIMQIKKKIEASPSLSEYLSLRIQLAVFLFPAHLEGFLNLHNNTSFESFNKTFSLLYLWQDENLMQHIVRLSFLLSPTAFIQYIEKSGGIDLFINKLIEALPSTPDDRKQALKNYILQLFHKK